MARFEVRRDRKVVGAFDTDDAELLVQIAGKPASNEMLSFPNTEHVNYWLYRTRDACIIRVTERCSNSLGPAELISCGEAVALCRSNDVAVPSWLSGQAIQTEEKSSTGHAQLSNSDEHRERGPIEFTIDDISAVRTLQSALYNFPSGYFDDESLNEIGVAIAAVSHFASTASKELAQSARRVACQSAQLLSDSSDALVAACDVLGVGKYHHRVSKAYADFDADEVTALIAASFGTPLDLNHNVDPDAVRIRVSKTMMTDVRKMLGFRITVDRKIALWSAIRLGIALRRVVYETCGSHLFDLPFPTGVIAEFRTDSSLIDATNDFASEPSNPLPDADVLSQSVGPRRKSGTFYRDYQWLQWHRDKGLREGEIRDKWNALSDETRLEFARNSTAANVIAEGKAGWDLVSKGLSKVTDELESFVRTRSETSGDTEVSEGF